MGLTAYCLHWHINRSSAFRKILAPIIAYEQINFVGWNGKEKLPYHKNDIVIFCQLPPTEEWLQSNSKNNKVFWIPMADYAVRPHYLRKHKVKAFAFSSEAQSILQDINIGFKRLVFGVKPKNFNESQNYKKAFYWNRTNLYKVEQLEAICSLHGIEKLMVINKPDEKSFSFPEKYPDFIHVFQSSWDDKRAKTWYDWHMKNVGYFIAPRAIEGVGLSFLEAMAYGKIVIAENNPAMNNYILSNVNGYLTNKMNPTNTKPSNIALRSHESAKQFYENWIRNDSNQMVNYILGIDN